MMMMLIWWWRVYDMTMLLMLMVESYEFMNCRVMFMHSWSVKAMMKKDDVATVGSLRNIPLDPKMVSNAYRVELGTWHTCESMWKMCTWLCVTMWKMCDLTMVMRCECYVFNLMIIWWCDYLFILLWWCLKLLSPINNWIRIHVNIVCLRWICIYDMLLIILNLYIHSYYPCVEYFSPYLLRVGCLCPCGVDLQVEDT
jgi:hypothetical protein